MKKSYDMKSKEAEDAEIVLETYKRAPQVLLKDQSKVGKWKYMYIIHISRPYVG